MNKIERIKLVKAMEFICRNINDEEILGYYTKGKNFADLMDTFLRCMRKASKSGGLCCDSVVSNKQ